MADYMNDIPVSIGFYNKNRAPTWELCEVKIFMINNVLKLISNYIIECIKCGISTSTHRNNNLLIF